MKVLLDTNILIHREASTVRKENVGPLFNWLDQLKYEKIIHPLSVMEIQSHDDERVRTSFEIKLASYKRIIKESPIHPKIQELLDRDDKTDNSRNDSRILNELVAGRVDYLITEDRGIHRKALKIGFGQFVFTIDDFLEKVGSENPTLAAYKNLTVEKCRFGDVDLTSPFFDSFRLDYPLFDWWFLRNSDNEVYVSYMNDELAAFLYLKIEGPDENYSDLTPPLKRGRHLKIGTFKVELNGYKLGERFVKIVFDNAIRQNVDDIYVTIFDKSVAHSRLIGLLEEFGFVHHGTKTSAAGVELVYRRDMIKQVQIDDPKLSFPFFSKSTRAFLVPIYPDYHTSLLPDSILNNESPHDFKEQAPYRNAIRKVYVGRSIFRKLERGDVVVFYRTSSGGGAYHRSVVTSVGIVDGVANPTSLSDFIRICRKRSVFSDEELENMWNWNTYNRPFVVGFLYSYAFPKRPNLKALIDHHVIKDIESAPRGFERITQEQFETILRLAEVDPRIVVD
jgi:predicted nucleic acid-binding protein